MSKQIGEISIFNATPHPINFLYDGQVIEVASDFVISATVQEEVVRTDHDGIEYVRTTFAGNAEGEALIRATYDAHDQCVIVGSIIAAQAYPGRVMAMVPAPGFERVPPAEKRMLATKFTTF